VEAVGAVDPGERDLQVELAAGLGDAVQLQRDAGQAQRRAVSRAAQAVAVRGPVALRHQQRDRAAHDLGGRPAEQPLGGGVEERDPAVGVGRDDRVVGGVGDRAGDRLAAAQLLLDRAAADLGGVQARRQAQDDRAERDDQRDREQPVADPVLDQAGVGGRGAQRVQAERDQERRGQ
jgi:hypothetical protein